MEEDSEGLRMLNRYGDRTSVTCWASTFDINGPSSGFGIEVGHILAGAMDDVDNDLVVPTSSALAFGTPVQVLNCSHVQYFGQKAVRTAIDNYFNPQPLGASSTDAATINSAVGAAMAGSTVSAEAILKILKRHKPPRLPAS
jgi:hypothetical protein